MSYTRGWELGLGRLVDSDFIWPNLGPPSQDGNVSLIDHSRFVKQLLFYPYDSFLIVFFTKVIVGLVARNRLSLFFLIVAVKRVHHHRRTIRINLRSCFIIS